MENSTINWTDHTWNPWVGCRHVSAECDHCYADALVTNRMGRDFSVVQRTKTWKEPPKWNRKAPELASELGRRVRVFCASLTDFFIQDADQWRDEAWEVIRQCTQMDWLILTKRPQLIARRLPADWNDGWPHVWLGTTCGVRESYPRLDALREIPAAVRFISAEPLLDSLHDINLTSFHWLIAGGESGPGFRPMQDEWAIELREICARENVGFHFKQHAAPRAGQGVELCGNVYHEPPLVTIGKMPRIKETISLPKVVAIVKAGPDKMSGSLKSMNDEALASEFKRQYEAIGKRLTELRPLCVDLRKRFCKLRRSDTIMGCETWTEFCQKHLKYSDRHIRRIIEGENPATEKHRAKLGRKSGAALGNTERAPEASTLNMAASKPPFAISHSPIDDSETWSKEDASRRIVSWTLFCLKGFTAIEKRQVVEDAFTKLLDELAFEEPEGTQRNAVVPSNVD